MVNGTMSIYKYDDSWNYIHTFKTISNLSENNVCLRFILISVILMCVYSI